MKKTLSMGLLGAAILLSGCFCKALPRNRSLGHMDLAATNAIFKTEFVAPKGGASFVLAFPAERVNSGAFCSHPDWPLSVLLQIRMPTTDPTFLLSKEFGTNDFQFTNWHSPATSILFTWDLWSPGVFREGKTYELVLSAKQPVPALGTAEVFLHWMDE